jgi:death-on-curing family protein
MTTHYPSLQACRDLLFPLIRREMATMEPAPFYEDERRGMEKLESIFSLMQRGSYYPDFTAKAAYLFCSIIDGHPFSNGNKRLAVATLTYFLVLNGKRISAPSMHAVREALQGQFPRLRWEEVVAFHHPHEYFFYHLALIVADRTQKGKMTFREEQRAVGKLLEFVTQVED